MLNSKFDVEFDDKKHCIFSFFSYFQNLLSQNNSQPIISYGQPSLYISGGSGCYEHGSAAASDGRGAIRGRPQ